ncbi:pseudouridine synthase [Pelagicoccus sp. SDUM812003]|uniref:pseudouridine synthase n=1 Tax=Pelagicoccus sp. SDUM812003 TaxID=3041267 RepID=UPI00280E1A51|nr:pseudouridine synthase [Pelagicoccus sp. SDUM812003]MDQ8202987.1 pseudouridine synthase [Pelagicoccus sp. SDUM812003]
MSSPNLIRTQKLLSEAGICSRRVAEEYIKNGEVTINGKVAELGSKVDPQQDDVRLNGRRIRASKKQQVVIALNKPKGFICSNDDPHNERTVFDLLPKELADERLFCAGRLDKDSEGLLIITNDGELANQLMHPSNMVTKRYHVSLKQPFPRAKLFRLTRGVTVEGEKLKVEKAVFIGDKKKEDSTEIDVAMHHGKKREIRRLFQALHFDVKKLKRYQIGKYSIKGMPKGAGIQLTPREIELLFKPDLSL